MRQGEKNKKKQSARTQVPQDVHRTPYGIVVPWEVLRRFGTVLDFTVEFELEDDGRWVADVPAIPGCVAYGSTRKKAMANVAQLLRCWLNERIEYGESLLPDSRTATLVATAA